MTSNERIERSVSAWLREDAAFRVPDHLEEVLAATRSTGQRPAWSSLERWLPVDTTFRPRLFTTPRAGRLVMVAALILLVLAIAILAAGSYQQRLPEPFGLARNGVFAESRGGDLFTLDVSTSQRTLLLGGDTYDFGAFFSRDGTKFSFLRSDGPPDDPAVLTLYVANADGSGVRPVTPPTKSLDWSDWSPDGSRIAYMAAGQLFVVDIAGGPPRRLEGTGKVHFPTWLPPDGKDIVFRAETASPAVFAIAADGSGKPRRISKTPANNKFDYQSIAVAPDGRHVAFTRWSADGVPRIYALDVSTGAEMMYPLSGAGQRGTVYSPDGSLISFARLSPDGSLQMAVADADGTGGAQLLGPVAAGTPTGAVDTYWIFTPDGKALIVRFGNDQSGATHLVPLDGSPSQLLDSGAFEFVDVQRLAP